MSGVGSIDKALRTSAPDRLVETRDAYITATHGSKNSTVWLADYRTTTLAPAGAELDDGLSEQLGAATRAFARQTAVLEARAAHSLARLHLPVTAWGERAGVLSVGLDADRVPAERPALVELA